ncbi:hypothetical protein APF79_04205 [bacterium BRH_c32]|nr:MAG: hypothetical protein APF79_04205 [bacterium BRH_c32]
MKKTFIQVIAFVILTFSMTYGQNIGIDKVGTTSFQFLKVIPDARATGMGEAFVSVTDNSESVFWNPAGLSKINGFDASFSYIDYFLDVSHLSFSAAYNLDGIGVIGVQALMNDIGSIEVTRVSNLYRDENGNYNPGLTGETVTPGSKVFGLSFSRKLTDKFAFGLTAKYAYEDLVVKSASSIIFDGGLLYQTGFRSIQIGASVRHFGPEVKFFDKSYPLPQTFTIGISANLLAPENSLLMDINDQRMLFAFDLSHPRDYTQQYQVGLEYAFKEMFFLRAGYKANFDEEGLTLGAGVKYNNYRIDYSFNDYGDYLGNVHRFTIGFSTN